MKTKTLLLSLLAGAFLCFSNVSYAQYHHSGSSSSSSSSGSGDNAFAQGNYDINVGVGFVGSGLGDVVGSGVSQSVSPAYEFTIERALSDHISLGVGFAYQTATASSSTSYASEIINYTTGAITPVTYTTIDAYKVSLLNVTFRGAYHFSAGDKLDPYLGIQLGYCDATATDDETSNDPSVGSSSSSAGIAGVEYGLYGGARYFFTDHIGAWFELQYARATFTYNGYSSSINVSNILNLGITFKW
jgi:outer membrane protein W